MMQQIIGLNSVRNVQILKSCQLENCCIYKSREKKKRKIRLGRTFLFQTLNKTGRLLSKVRFFLDTENAAFVSLACFSHRLCNSSHVCKIPFFQNFRGKVVSMLKTVMFSVRRGASSVSQ